MFEYDNERLKGALIYIYDTRGEPLCLYPPSDSSEIQSCEPQRTLSLYNFTLILLSIPYERMTIPYRLACYFIPLLPSKVYQTHYLCYNLIL